jgi:hypothetical protein
MSQHGDIIYKNMATEWHDVNSSEWQYLSKMEIIQRGLKLKGRARYVFIIIAHVDNKN